MNWRRLFPCQPNAVSLRFPQHEKPTQFGDCLPDLPDELILEIISWLPVKSLIRFRSVNKSFNPIISDPFFVQMHLKKSARNPHLALSFNKSLLTFPVSRLLDKLPITVHLDPYYQLKVNGRRWRVVGSCNGLLCLIDRNTSPYQTCLSIWNPATWESSEFYSFNEFWYKYIVYSFGYDNLVGTFKVVEFCVERDDGNVRNMVKVSSFGDTCWRYIQCFPVLPLLKSGSSQNNGVHLSGTINWLALRDYSGLDYFDLNYRSISIELYVILSLDLSTETYTQLLLPRGFDKVPHYKPAIVVLMDCLCFCHDFEETHFIIWQMKDFGVHESWIQLYNISYKNLFSRSEHKCFDLLPLYLFENGDTLILSDEDNMVLTYNCRDNIVEKIRITKRINWSCAKHYVESLVSTR